MMYDVVIVGSGPAGCAAAYDLSSKGRKVLLLDRHNFPRTKACAGGLTVKTLNSLRYSVEPVIKATCNDLVIGKGLDKKVLLKSRDLLCAMTVRSQFDTFCLNKTLKKGALFSVVKKIKHIYENDSHVEIITDNLGVVRSKYLIGADGAGSRVRKLTGEFKEISNGFAVEGVIPADQKQMPRMEFDYGIMKAGYGWIFPKDDHINVGLFTNSVSERPSRAKLMEYVIKKFNRDDIRQIKGRPIPTGGWNYTPKMNRVLLVGDAAGLSDPLLGEGIYNAVKSGQLAAFSIEQSLATHANARDIYATAINEIKKDLLACHRSSFWFYKYLHAGYRILTSYPVKSAFIKGYSMGMTFSEIQRNFFKLPFRTVEKINCPT